MHFLSPSKVSSLDPFQKVLILSGALGFFLGIFGNSTWHHAIEGAQVLAEVVSYPIATPFFLYQIKAWSLLHQIPALFLKVGFTEIQLSILLSGIIGMLSYQCLAGAFYVFSGDSWLALLFPFFVEYARVMPEAPTYPIILMGCIASYGIMGLMTSFLSLVLLSQGRVRSGGTLLGLLPAIHPALGLITIFIAGVSFLWIRPANGKKIIPYVALGACLSLLSFAFYHHSISNYPITEKFSSFELSQFIQNWDSHRLSVPYDHPGFLAHTLVFLVGVTAWFYFPKSIRPSARLLSSFLVVSGIVGSFAALISYIPQEMIPMTLLKLMPNRILNFNLLAAAAVIYGILRYVPHPLFQGTFYVGITAMILLARFFPDFSPYAFLILGFWTIILFFIAAPKNPSESSPLKYQPLFRGLRIGTLFLLGVLAFKIIGAGFSVYSQNHRESFSDWRSDPVFKKIKEGKGILLIGSDLSTLQLVTRRPVLIDPGALDVISYFPELGPAFQRICKKIYGIDLFHAPPDQDPVAILPPQGSQNIWQTRTLLEWQEIAKEFHVTQILVSDWKLDLPVIIQSESFTLYEIPS